MKMPPLEVVDYGDGIPHVYETVQRDCGLVSRCVGYVTAGRLFRRLADRTFLETDSLTIHARSEGDAVDVLTAVGR